MRNVPDDWNCYWTKCAACGAKYHASDGYCTRCEELAESGPCCDDPDFHQGVCMSCSPPPEYND